MNFEKIHDLIGHIPFITEQNARYIYELIIEKKIQDVLELGIGHGAAICYIAAALDELKRGTVTGVDLLEAADMFMPSAEELVQQFGLERYVEIYRMESGYNWFLHDKIASQTKDNACEECYDLCIIDGPKNWTIDGAAFFMVDKLLRKDGRLIFDDYDWTYSQAHETRDATDGITHRGLSTEELTTPHIKEVVDLLVLQHPNYGKLTMLNGTEWVIAEKVAAQRKVVELTRSLTLKECVHRLVMLLKETSYPKAVRKP
ncbi:MAG: class I SAM-dependent methyltransferase [Alphaproteobacteria bacterium]